MPGSRGEGWTARRLVLAVVALSVIALACASRGEAQAVRTGRVRGTVRDTAGRALAGATVSAGPTLLAVTDSAGAFALRDVPLGRIELTVHRLGYEPLRYAQPLDSATEPLDLRLTPIAAVLAAVHVRARRAPEDARLAGFNERRARHVGYFITREQIERRNDMRLTEALRQVPGVRPYTMPGALGRSVRLAGARCAPVVFVDGFAANLGSFDLDMIDLSTVEGIEVYPNGVSIPAAFLGTYGSENCGVVAIWSAPARPKVRANQLPPGDVDVAALVASGAVHRPETVDVQARYVAGSARAVYPDSLLRERVGAHVVAEFVVDTTGAVEPGTVRIVTATPAAFGSAVRDALSAARFEPAQASGTRVQALVRLPFDFDPTAPDSSAQPRRE